LTPIDGRDVLDNPTARPGLLKNNRRYRIDLHVRVTGDRASIAVDLDNVELTSWEGPLAQLGPGQAWSCPGPCPLAIGANLCATAFHTLSLRPLSGRAKLLERRDVLPTSDATGVSWRYSLTEPAEDWASDDADDAAWPPGAGAFGRDAGPAGAIRTPWTTADIWLRREFTLSELPAAAPLFWLHHDNDAELFLNGVPAAVGQGWTVGRYYFFPLTAESRAALRLGRNVLAIHCRQIDGPQYIDAGLVEFVPVRELEP
jgi:hypothetical protein